MCSVTFRSILPFLGAQHIHLVSNVLFTSFWLCFSWISSTETLGMRSHLHSSCCHKHSFNVQRRSKYSSGSRCIAICVVLDHPSMNLISPICQLIQCHDLGKLVENYAVPSNFMQYMSYMSQENYNPCHKKAIIQSMQS